MQPVCVFNCFKLCLLVALCTADSSSGSDSNSDSLSESSEEVVKLVGKTADNAANVDDADRVAYGTGAVMDNGLDQAADIETNNQDEADTSVKDLYNNKPIDDKLQNDLQGDNPDNNVPADGDKIAAQDDPSNGPINDDENEVQGKVPGEELNTKDDNIKLDELDDGNKNTEHKTKLPYDIPNGSQDGWARIDKTFVKPAFKLSETELEKFKIWPGASVPFYIDEFSYDKVLRDQIRGYLNDAHRQTMVTFQELPEPPTDEDGRWVFFVNRRGQLDCKDYSTKSFTNKGVQKVVVGYDCLNHGGPMAAIVLALLGVPPQHNSPDRDRHITINKDHILPDKRGLFNRLRNDEWLFHDLPYDYHSASHYSMHKYTADGHPSITINETALSEFNSQGGKRYDLFKDIGEATQYSPSDIEKVQLLYNDIIYKRALKGLKLEDCKTLYRPRPGFSSTRLKLKPVVEKLKPKQYLVAIQKKLLATKDIEGETLSSLESK